MSIYPLLIFKKLAMAIYTFMQVTTYSMTV